MKIVERDTCRVSGGKLIKVLDLGDVPTSCFPLPQEPDPEKTPLVLCLNKESGLVQLKHTVDPDAMYKEYWYMSGVNQSMTLALKNIVDEAISRVKLEKGDTVLDIASNDWTLLKNYSNVRRIGIDPSNIKPSCAINHSDVFVNDYFTAHAYKNAVGDRMAKIVTSICVLYDLENPIQFAKDVKSVLHENGLWVMEMSYLPTMLERNSFETIVNEHIEYYSLQAIEYILNKADMAVEDVSLNDVNGGSFRLYVRHAGKERMTQAVLDMRKKELSMGLCEPEVYNNFAERVEQNKKEMLDFLTEQKKIGKLVIGYAASTKGNTMLAYYGIGPDLVPYVADRNPMKFGRQTVTRIPIISEDEARQMRPDYLLVLAYHFMDEMLIREKQFLDRGGAFICPIPKLKIIDNK